MLLSLILSAVYNTIQYRLKLIEHFSVNTQFSDGRSFYTVHRRKSLDIQTCILEIISDLSDSQK